MLKSLVRFNSYNGSAVSSGQTYYYVVTALGVKSAESGYFNEAAAVIPWPHPNRSGGPSGGRFFRPGLLAATLAERGGRMGMLSRPRAIQSD